MRPPKLKTLLYGSLLAGGTAYMVNRGVLSQQTFQDGREKIHEINHKISKAQAEGRTGAGKKPSVGAEAGEKNPVPTLEEAKIALGVVAEEAKPMLADAKLFVNAVIEEGAPAAGEVKAILVEAKDNILAKYDQLKSDESGGSGEAKEVKSRAQSSLNKAEHKAEEAQSSLEQANPR
ncbi:hypothetical protein BASA82_000091 [Batrachochytrium salamandrivorans]|nr:hypothetical protein BASA82_000091 [Batrachochytrium salamandrivorans]